MGKFAASLLIILGTAGSAFSLLWLWFIILMEGWSHVRSSGDQWFKLALAGLLLTSIAAVMVGIRSIRAKR